MKTHLHLWLHLAELFLEREMFQTTIVGKNQNTHFVEFYVPTNALLYK